MKKPLIKLFKMKDQLNKSDCKTNKKWLVNIFQEKTFFILMIVSFFSINATAQEAEDKTGVALYLQNTEHSIHSDNKYLSGSGTTIENKDLSNAIVLQQYAIKLYQLGKENEALICSSKARQLAVTLLQNFKGTDYAGHYDNFVNEEAQITQIKMDATTTEYWLTASKK